MEPLQDIVASVINSVHKDLHEDLLKNIVLAGQGSRLLLLLLLLLLVLLLFLFFSFFSLPFFSLCRFSGFAERLEKEMKLKFETMKKKVKVTR